MGRTQLAQMYFPYVLPQTAWQKLRGLLAADPALAHLTKLKRPMGRTRIFPWLTSTDHA